MIFEELLVISPSVVFRGSLDFEPLDENEVDEEIQIPCQILSTCRTYYEEATPILYGKNKFAFYTGIAEEPGMFWEFPIAVRCMPYVTDLRIYFCVDSLYADSSIRVGHFLKALRLRATRLDQLAIIVASNCYYDTDCVWDVLLGNHPVCQEQPNIAKERLIKHLRLRPHDGALFTPQYACRLAQMFEQTGGRGDHSLTFTKSCSRPPGTRLFPRTTSHSPDECAVCGWPTDDIATKPI